MNNGISSQRRVLPRFIATLLASGLVLLALPGIADELDDVTVSPQTMYSGNTFHGYAETRVLVENRSHTRAHVVTLVCPNNSWSYGNSINRLSRSVKIEPGARAVISLLQPPLPMNGDSTIRVEVDGRLEGTVRAPNANNHVNSSYGHGYGSTAPPVVLVSRSLDYEAVGRMLNANRGGFMAAMATGAPDSGGSFGYLPTAWMPDTRFYGRTNWLELDYATPVIVEKIRLYVTQPASVDGRIKLLGATGNVVATASLKSISSSSGNVREYNFSTTSEPVKQVRLEFDKTPPSNIGVDAVELVGPGGSQWASDARASSDNSVAGPATVSSGRTSPDNITALRSECSLAEWSDNWLAYTPFDAVALSVDDFTSLPAPAQAALADYLQAGGNLFVLGDRPLPETWRSNIKRPLNDGTIYAVGFGRCYALTRNDPGAVNAATMEKLRATLKESANYWESLPRDSAAANNALHVVDNLKIPVRGIVIIMLAFVVIIGPVNLILLSRRKRRTWMLWTIPAISLATTLIVFLYSLLREGITPDTRIAGITLLDQPRHHAATFGATGFYCPLTPGGGLRFDYGTEAVPLVDASSYNSGSKREVDWTRTQQFRSGWIAARVPAYFHLRRSETRRERLEVEKNNGAVSVVNGLGARIKTLWLADADGNISRATDIAAGQKAALAAAGLPKFDAPSGANGLNRDFGFALAKVDELSGSAQKYLLPGSYIAVLDANPFIENALGASNKKTRTEAVVFGIVETPSAP